MSGTQKGSLLKITINQKDFSKEIFQRKIAFSEEWQVYQPDKCGKNNVTDSSSSQSFKNKQKEWRIVRNITLLKNFILVSFKRCIVSVPKQTCGHYLLKRLVLYDILFLIF